MRIFLCFFQIFTMLIMSVYFIVQLLPKKQKEGKTDHVKMAHLQKMKSISLSRPLSERARPCALCEIVGQEEGLFALKAALFGKYPQHVLLYGPPGVGKTTAARLIFEEAKNSPGSPFLKDAPFIEMDASILRYDERGIADPLIGSVHDPIYQGAGELGRLGVPQIKQGAVTRAHGGILFLDEIGEMHPMEMVRLLKVMEDRVVRFESAYYERNHLRTDEYTKYAFEKGLPADFRLIAATTRSPCELPQALRSRAVEICFTNLTDSQKAKIVRAAAKRAGAQISKEQCRRISAYAQSGRDCVNMVEILLGAVSVKGRKEITDNDVIWAIRIKNGKNADFKSGKYA